MNPLKVAPVASDTLASLLFPLSEVVLEVIFCVFMRRDFLNVVNAAAEGHPREKQLPEIGRGVLTRLSTQSWHPVTCGSSPETKSL